MKASTLVVVVVLKNDDWLMVSEKCDITHSFYIAVSLSRQRLTLFLKVVVVVHGALAYKTYLVRGTF